MPNQETVDKATRLVMELIYKKDFPKISEGRKTIFIATYAPIITRLHNQRRSYICNMMRNGVLDVKKNKIKFLWGEEVDQMIQIDGKQHKQAIRMPGTIPTSAELEKVIMQ